MIPIRRTGLSSFPISIAFPGRRRLEGAVSNASTRTLRRSLTQTQQQTVASKPGSPPFTPYPLPQYFEPAPAPLKIEKQKPDSLQAFGQRRMDASFYMRELPASAGLILYDSPEGKKIFKQALEEGGLEAFFPLSQQFLTQEEPACEYRLLV